LDGGVRGTFTATADDSTSATTGATGDDDAIGDDDFGDDDADDVRNDGEATLRCRLPTDRH
jgi:hypothetical protein